jgi:hypothetical protein
VIDHEGEVALVGIAGVLPVVRVFFDPDPLRLCEMARSSCTNRFSNWSRSYRKGVALVAGWNGRVGIDVEHLAVGADADLDDAFSRVILSSGERRELVAHQGPALTRELRELWCAKEALSKALGDALDYPPARLESPSRWPAGRTGCWRAVRLDLDAAMFGGRPGERALVVEDYMAWLVFEVDADD